jgi:hypothetical protein
VGGGAKIAEKIQRPQELRGLSSQLRGTVLKF